MSLLGDFSPSGVLVVFTAAGLWLLFVVLFVTVLDGLLEAAVVAGFVALVVVVVVAGLLVSDVLETGCEGFDVPVTCLVTSSLTMVTLALTGDTLAEPSRAADEACVLLDAVALLTFLAGGGLLLADGVDDVAGTLSNDFVGEFVCDLEDALILAAGILY